MDTSEPCYSIETLVEALYRGVLSRASDEKGFWSNVKSLALRGGEATDLASFVENFLSSQECQNKAARQFARGLLPTSTLQNCEPVDIVSLGSHCLVSYALKEMGLKRYSCPFDWIFSRPSMVEHCIKDSFVTLTDRSQYQSVTDESGTELPGCCHHAFYRNLFGVNRVFNHRDMRIKRIYEYLVRSVDRFTRLLASFNPKIFVILTPEWHINNEQFVSPTIHSRNLHQTFGFSLFL